ncbi:MAG: RsiV family protein, partial [Sarcina sp.]
GAHGMPSILTYNYNTQTGEKLMIGDLFKDGFDYKTFLNNEIKKDINKNKDLYFSGNDGFKEIKEDQDFYISTDGITIVFQVYEIAPYAAGIIYFNIPIENIAKDVKPILFSK